MLRTASEIQAETLCDLGLEMAMEATVETAYLTHVRLNHLRCTAGVLAPRRYRIRSVEPEATQEKPLTMALRSFRMETDPLTGEDRVVAFFPNPVTGKVEREDAPG